MKQNIVQLKEDIASAKVRQSEASKDIQRIERDMNEFSSNKDGKLVELQKSLDALKKSLSKSSVSVKSVQKELQSARLESEQAGGDLAAAQEQLVEVDSTLMTQGEEINALIQEQARVKVDDYAISTSRATLIYHRTPTISRKRISTTKEQSYRGLTMSFAH